MDPQKITELANLLRNNGDKILSSEFKLTLSGSLLRALNDSFTLIADTGDISTSQKFQVVKPINSKSPVFRDLQLIYDFVQKTTLLCIVHYPSEIYFEGIIDISKFRLLKRLEVQKTNIKQITGIQSLRSQLEQIICIKSICNIEDIITHCGGDNSNGFVWNELKIADFSFNNLQSIDTSLEFAQFLQHLNLHHNQLESVEAVKWLPHLKTIDLSFNKLQFIPQFHIEACKRLQSLNISNNFVEDLMESLSRLDELNDLDLSDNCLMDHSYLLPLSTLVNLKFLNLYGNPLYCHPKHRLATAQFLHKNTLTVKFILDFEPLSKNEKAITGTQQLRHVGSLNRFIVKSSAVSMSSSRHTPTTHTPASSVGSFSSFTLLDASEDAKILNQTNVSKKKHSKIRTVNFVDVIVDEKIIDTDETLTNTTKNDVSLNTKTSITPIDSEHLETKRHIENLREKYGTEWLQTEHAEIMQSLLGLENTNTNTEHTDSERNKSRQLFNDYLGEWSTTSMADSIISNSSTIRTSTPVNDLQQTQEAHSTKTETISGSGSRNVKVNDIEIEKRKSFYISTENLNATNCTDESSYATAEETITDVDKDVNKETDDPYSLSNIYSSAPDEESEISEVEDDADTFIVSLANSNEAMFFTISSNSIKETNLLTQRTKTKWSLKILESCERTQSDTIRINFDSVIDNKKERIYTVEKNLCQDLERKLREILANRDLVEMNQIVYRCVNCSSQFSRENKPNNIKQKDIICPDCKSFFVVEIRDVPKPLKKRFSKEKLSSSFIVQECPINIPLILKPNKNSSDSVEETTSIGKRPSRLSAINTQKSRNLPQSLKSSANSLNESSSCSRITNSQSSFDSNQSVVGSSNTDRDADFKSTNESDVDILSNPSQSSIEVLDPTNFSSRKTSEERRITQMLNLDIIDDQNYAQTLTERDFQELIKNADKEMTIESPKQSPNKSNSKSHINALAHINLTESSSSGSVTDSICTSYEQSNQQQQQQKNVNTKTTTTTVLEGTQENSLDAKSKISSIDENNKIANSENENSHDEFEKKEDSSISSVFGVLFQSTNILMSSSKKLINAESASNNQTESNISIKTTTTDTCKPYNFDYNNFHVIDHRLKLYFYQTKFEDKDEHFKWIARGRIYIEKSHTLCDGIIVLSTCKCYLMEIYAQENDDVAKWLRHIVSVTVDRMETIQLLPWKIGLSFYLRDWGGFLLLFQDILRTDSLLLYFANNSLPSQCDLIYQPAEMIVKKLNNAVRNKKLSMFSLTDGCEVICENAKRSFNICGLLTTESHLYITSNKLNWLSVYSNDSDANDDVEISLTQLMINLVEVERISDKKFVLNFLDETQKIYEYWHCTFKTKENADSCLNAIQQSWEPLFDVPLFNA